MIRLGKKPINAESAADMNQKPRPVKLVLSTEEQKMKLLKAAKNLRPMPRQQQLMEEELWYMSVTV